MTAALKWFPNGADSEPEPYEGGRDLESLVDLYVQLA